MIKFQGSNWFKITLFMASYCLSHLLVDLACMYLIAGVLDIGSNLLFILLAYNALAFVLQAPFGLFIERYINPRYTAISGLILTALSFLFWNEPVIAITLAGTGNALFHVSGGILVLSLKERKATYSGFFVAPGGIGLAVGSYLAISHVNMADEIIPILLVIMSIILYFVYNPDYTYKEAANTKVSYAFIPIVLILLPIAVRSLIGLSIAFPWKSNPDLYMYLILSIALGKIFGGILADKFGLLKVGLAGLLLSAPLLAFYSSQPALGILGAFIFNFTMPVTLILVLNIIPQHRGFSFGLTTAALFIGAIPAIIKTNGWIKDSFTLTITILLAALLLIAAWNLEKYFKKANNQDGLRNTIFKKLITYYNN